MALAITIFYPKKKKILSLNETYCIFKKGFFYKYVLWIVKECAIKIMLT